MSVQRLRDYASLSYETDMSEAWKMVRRLLVEKEPPERVVARARELYREAYLKERARLDEQALDDRADRTWLALKYGMSARYHVVHANP